MRRTVAWLVILSLLLPACASRNVPPIGADGQAFKPESDERALWAKAEKEEEALLKKAKVYDDPMLDEYLARIGDRLTPDQVREAGGPGFKFGVIRDPTLNAFALPNGHIYVHTVLLSRLDNESQLAMIVGHEMTHVTHRHALSFQRDVQTKQILYTVAAVAASIGVAAVAGSRAQKGDYIGAAVIGQTANAILGLGLALTAMAAINGYGRDLEREADRKAEHARLALASYEKAVELDETAPEPHRQLGFLYYQQKDNARAKAAFEKYLALKPTAPDAKRIKEYLVELDR